MNHFLWRPIACLCLVVCVVLTGCADSTYLQPQQHSLPQPASDAEQRRAQLAMFERQLHKHIAELASDVYEGRAPASPGEEKTVAYLKQQFRALGLQPGNGDSYFQQVPVAQTTSLPTATLSIRAENYQRRLQYRTEMMVSTLQQVNNVGIDNSEMVFVGYGIVAPEYQWNDYAGIDVRGKTVVILVNDPGYAMPDSERFTGKAMTYYGRWSYKYEEAARQGAAAAIIIHETGAAGYPWAVVSGSWSGTQVSLAAANGNRHRCNIESWIQFEVARELFAAAGLDLDAQMRAAAKPGFKAVPLKMRATTQLQNHISYSDSNNVVAAIVGSRRPQEVVIFTAHWDHLGKNPVVGGDNIFNGAVDNATGTAGLLALAKAFSEQATAPERTLLFLAVTAEESGLLGSKYYAENPIYPLKNTVAVINMDAMNVFGPTKDVVVIGYGSSELESYLETAAKAQGRYLTPEPTPEKGYYYRSDHFSMAKLGVPALYAKSGIEHRAQGTQWMVAQMAAFTAERYHKASDEYEPQWDLRGSAQDLQLYFDIAQALASNTDFPNWYEGNEFRAIRDQSRSAP